MPVPLTMLPLRQAEGTLPENRFWLAFSVCSWPREDHSAGSVPVSVLLLKFTCVRRLFPDQEAGTVPATSSHQLQGPSGVLP